MLLPSGNVYYLRFKMKYKVALFFFYLFFEALQPALVLPRTVALLVFLRSFSGFC